MDQGKPKITFVTNMCTHYSRRLFELLAGRCDVDFYFTGGHEAYWEKKNKTWDGAFRGHYLSGIFLLPRFRITPGLFKLVFKKCDIIIKTIDDRFALPLVFFMAKTKRVPFIFWVGLWHHPRSLFHKTSFIFTKYIYRHSDAIVVYGSHIKDYLIRLGVKEERIFCAWHAVDNREFQRSLSPQEITRLKESLGLRNERVLLYVGRLEKEKGLNHLIEAASSLKLNDVCLLFIGEGKEKDSIKDQCLRYKVKALFLGHIPNNELYRYYALADVFVLPSVTTAGFKEPWGLVVNEAMNTGCPVVATDAVGAAMGGLVENGRTGFVVPEQNSQELGKAIQKILDDPSLQESMSKAAIEKVRGWTPERMAQGFYDAISFVSTRS